MKIFLLCLAGQKGTVFGMGKHRSDGEEQVHAHSKELQQTAQVEVLLHSQIPTEATAPWERPFLLGSLGLAAIREFRNSSQAKKIKQPEKEEAVICFKK